jgi:outer membrane protein OmpA-like peptidoglycan-associated protein
MTAQSLNCGIAGSLLPDPARARFSTEGYGADKPIASDDTEEGHTKNRRTELVVVKK